MRQGSQPPHRGARQVGDVDGLQVELQCARADAGEIEHFGHQSLEVVALVVDGLEQLDPIAGAKARAGLQQSRHRRLDRRERGLEVVAHGCEECGAGTIDLKGEPGLRCRGLQLVVG